MPTQEYTPDENVNEILELLLHKAKGILKEKFIGMYLYGSLSSGDFNLQSSDIDFIIVTTEVLADGTVSRLDAMHNEIWASGSKWAAKLEGSYVPMDMFQSHEAGAQPCPTVNEGRFYVHRRGSDWVIQLHVIREKGVVVEGPEPKKLLAPVSPEEIRRAVIGSLNEWWFPMIDNRTWLIERGSIYHAFAVITMCRALHALHHGTIVSKPVAAAWASEQLGAPWDSLIEKALACQHGTHEGFFQEALDFIQFTRARLPYPNGQAQF